MAKELKEIMDGLITVFAGAFRIVSADPLLAASTRDQEREKPIR